MIRAGVLARRSSVQIAALERGQFAGVLVDTQSVLVVEHLDPTKIRLSIIVLRLDFIYRLELAHGRRYVAFPSLQITFLEPLILVPERLILPSHLHVLLVEFVVEVKYDILLPHKILQLVLVDLDVPAKVVVLLLIAIQVLGIRSVSLA